MVKDQRYPEFRATKGAEMQPSFSSSSDNGSICLSSVLSKIHSSNGKLWCHWFHLSSPLVLRFALVLFCKSR